MTPQEADKRVEFRYDDQGRRVRKTVLTWDDQEEEWGEDPAEDLLFLYDGWNVALVHDRIENTLLRLYTWGLDLSGTIHGAGGIGGLLAVEEPQDEGESKKHWFCYDANGNVGQLLKYVADPQSVTLAAHYEYDPYGERHRHRRR